MRFGYQLLERHAVVVNNATRVMVTESSPSSSLEDTSTSVRNGNTPESPRNEQSGQKRDLTLGKKKPRENTMEESGVPSKKARIAKETRKIVGKNTRRVQETMESVTIDESSNTVESGGSPEVTQESSGDVNVEDEPMDIKNTSPDNVSVTTEGDLRKDIEDMLVDVEGEPSQDFILQEDQTLDNSEDLEDDDEDRLRICDPEEIAEDKNDDENVAELSDPQPPEPEVVEEKSEVCIGEDTEIVRKEGKSRRKNKKAKHHHRHKRDYSPAPEATIVSGDKNDFLKLKVKFTRPDTDVNGKPKNKLEDGSKHHRQGDGHTSPRQAKHKSYTIIEEAYTNAMQSPSNSINDEDSRNSQSTDDHDARSVTSSKEGQDELANHSKGNPLHNGSVQQPSSSKEKLMQMRQVRHKNITPTPPRAPMNTIISKVTAEEANKNTQKSPMLLTSANSSLTVSKVTAEERLKMMNNNNLESKRPSLEIIMVNKPNTVNLKSEKMTENQIKQKMLSGGLNSPVVKLTKTNSINSLLPKQNTLSLSLSKTKNSSEGSRKSGDLSEKTKDEKINRTAGKKGESFGVLDLSGKSTRSADSSPASESSCPSPNQSSSTLNQPLVNRHLTSMSSPHRSASNSPPVTSLSKASPTRGLQHPSAGMWNLMTLSDTAANLRNVKPSQIQEGMKRQIVIKPKNPSPQRYPSMSSPARTPSPRASPTHLKIPNPNFMNRPKAPTNAATMPRPTSMNRPLAALTARPIAASSSRPPMILPKMAQNQSIAIAKKRAEMNGRNPNIPPPPPAIPISTLFKMESMARKYDLEKMARGLSVANKAAAGIPSS